MSKFDKSKKIKTEEAEAEESGLSRRGFLTASAAGVAGGAALTGASTRSASADEMAWDATYDVIVVGSGAAGLPAAIAARDGGASVLLVEINFDIGGTAILSGAAAYLGGGTAFQQERGIDDNPDRVFNDWTNRNDMRGRYNDREIVRTYADTSVETYDFLTENGVVFDEVTGPSRLDTVPGRPRARQWRNPAEVVVQSQNGSGLMRPLERSARAKGVDILLQHKMTSILRESPNSGRVMGITAMEVDDWFNPKHTTLNLRARNGVILATGGHAGNLEFRRVFDPRLTEEYHQHGWTWAPRSGDAQVMGMAVGATLWGAGLQSNEADGQISKGRMGTWDNYHGLAYDPESPNFFRAKASGHMIQDWQNCILVKENGQRFYDETAGTRDYEYFAAAMEWTGDPNKLNGGGPIWAIMDADGLEREGLTPDYPHVDLDGYFFVADTLEELAAQLIENDYQWRDMPADALRETVERYNSLVDAGEDSDFGKPAPQYKIQTPPFYAGWNTPATHDTYAGLRTNTKAQVMDNAGGVVPGLYAAGECQGGFCQHGLGASHVYGYIAGKTAAAEG